MRPHGRFIVLFSVPTDVCVSLEIDHSRALLVRSGPRSVDSTDHDPHLSMCFLNNAVVVPRREGLMERHSVEAREEEEEEKEEEGANESSTPLHTSGSSAICTIPSLDN